MPKLTLPTTCKMPSLSEQKPMNNYLIAAISSGGKKLSDEENKYLKIFIRLVDKACTEYQISREYLIEEVKDMQRGNVPGPRVIAIFGFWNNIENCINTVRRIFRIIEKIKTQDGVLKMNRVERILIEKNKDKITDLRDTIEHIDEEMQSIDIFVISLNEQFDGIYISDYEIKFTELFNLLERLKTIGISWINTFAEQ